ncbi:efflux RND transporter periplasmic adaptor subunit [Haliea sp. E1-2-M8]|uniref:efflux RND transporter periplasmic adaptor subunit n=1 Tax=Haliea sp. E1-2-M8 TaxID=3064706 RepID=UPI0027182698|nr:efflux RND transporter periplasmic adaptor subunit [Haliea sp. E1-2-M8]MDO8861446.1 efflux RND transporter periplasmic adaptor subunit [Haliea sp. E1-2-M8]
MASVKRQIILAVGLLAGATAVTFLLFLNRPSTEISEPVYIPVTVDVVEAEQETIRIPVQAQGTVSPLQQTELVAEVQGRIVEVAESFNVGGFLRQGEILLRIDPRDYEAQLARAEAALRSAESELLQERGRADVARREWERLPAGSQRSDEARDLYLRKPQLAQAEAQRLAAAADVNTARDDLERTVVRAPYDALIGAKHSELGHYVTPGASLAEVFAVAMAEVRLPIPQTRLAYLDLPGVATDAGSAVIDLYTDVGGDVTHWTARLHRSEGVFDERSRALFAVARIDDPYALNSPGREPLRIGTFVNASIQGRPMPGLVALPRYVLRAGDMVAVVDDNNLVRNRKVTTLRAAGDFIYVSSGLENGDLVILTALDSALTGAEVEVVSRISSSELRPQRTPTPAAPVETPVAPDVAASP